MAKTTLEKFGEKVREERLKKGFSIKEHRLASKQNLQSFIPTS
jgi:hypothetical protein